MAYGNQRRPSRKRRPSNGRLNKMGSRNNRWAKNHTNRSAMSRRSAAGRGGNGNSTRGGSKPSSPVGSYGNTDWGMVSHERNLNSKKNIANRYENGPVIVGRNKRFGINNTNTTITKDWSMGQGNALKNNFGSWGSNFGSWTKKSDGTNNLS